MECEIYWTQDNEKLGEINIMNEKNIILKVRNLSTSFLSDNKEINIVKNVSFDVKRGKALAIVGESGCGKSVTMNSILKLLGRNAKTDADEITFYEKQSNGTIKPHYINKIKKQNGKSARAKNIYGFSRSDVITRSCISSWRSGDGRIT